MTAALAHTLPTAFRFARTRARARLEHVALVVGICVPVPLLAVTGLSIPLPSSVERLAASLVPWAESSDLDATGADRGAGGSIIPAEDEGGPSGSPKLTVSRAGRASVRTAPGSKPAAARPGAPSARTGTRPGVTPDDRSPTDTTTPGGSRQEATSGGAADSPVQAPSAEQPGTRQDAPPPPAPPPPPPALRPPPPPPAIAPPPPPPITGIVDDTTNTVRDTTRPIVDDVGNTVDNVTKPVIGVKPVEAVKGVVPIGKK